MKQTSETLGVNGLSGTVKKFTDPRAVWEPGSRAAEYQIRMYCMAGKSRGQQGLLTHREYEEDIPPYNKIPTGNKKSEIGNQK